MGVFPSFLLVVLHFLTAAAKMNGMYLDERYMNFRQPAPYQVSNLARTHRPAQDERSHVNSNRSIYMAKPAPQQFIVDPRDGSARRDHVTPRGQAQQPDLVLPSIQRGGSRSRSDKSARHDSGHTDVNQRAYRPSVEYPSIDSVLGCAQLNELDDSTKPIHGPGFDPTKPDGPRLNECVYTDCRIPTCHPTTNVEKDGSLCELRDAAQQVVNSAKMVVLTHDFQHSPPRPLSGFPRLDDHASSTPNTASRPTVTTIQADGPAFDKEGFIDITQPAHRQVVYTVRLGGSAYQGQRTYIDLEEAARRNALNPAQSVPPPPLLCTDIAQPEPVYQPRKQRFKCSLFGRPRRRHDSVVDGQPWHKRSLSSASSSWRSFQESCTHTLQKFWGLHDTDHCDEWSEGAWISTPITEHDWTQKPSIRSRVRTWWDDLVYRVHKPEVKEIRPFPPPDCFFDWDDHGHEHTLLCWSWLRRPWDVEARPTALHESGSWTRIKNFFLRSWSH